MFDAAIGPRLEASSLRIRRVFSAAGTLEAALAAGVAGACGAVVMSVLRQGMSGIPYLRMPPQEAGGGPSDSPMSVIPDKTSTGPRP